ncbi:hemerythrin domain-containing protein [Nocardioides sp. URHA0020]|uniref:hemerythrin domain-containing protein n=1 Tax=Nocardioides sp. URHA0020 TaxID=1380392 RepID=UPI00048F0C01|nr:hemerythrin domain-containing protein [Nocardioides sp. URHA0020]
MGDAAEDRAKAATYPEGDVLRVLYEQHARIRDLFAAVKAAGGDRRSETFAELRTLLAVHETAEEMVIRPATTAAGGKDVADARNHEEAEANEVLQRLEKLDPAGSDFESLLAELEASVDEHAEAEEHEEFPLIESSCDEGQRQAMGMHLRAAEAVAPTHPHPSTAGSTVAQYAVGPFASIIDRTRDAVRAAMH